MTTCASSADAATLWWASPAGTEVIGQVSYRGHNEVGVSFSGDAYIPLSALGTGPSSPWMIAF